jgi:serine/threonine protein kinase
VGDPSPSPDDPVQIGAVLDGRYRIDAVIGSGGMGRVYRAEHINIGRPVAIKILHTDLGRNREATTRFQREAIASGRLDHPNIVTVTDSGFVDGVGLFLVMEALDGEPLGVRLERGRMPWGEALVILSGVLAGLRHAHDRGVVHRDIKPDNIFLAKKEGATIVKLLDFGIAKLYAGDANDPATTRAGLTVGTPAYLSPEQAVGGEITPASDLYSTTCVLYEMLTGRPPFEGKDPLSLLTAHVSKPPLKLHEAAPDLEFPAALEAMVARGLSKPARERFHSAGDYLGMVQEILGIVAPGTTARGSRPAIAVSAQDATAVLVDPIAPTRPAPIVTTPGPMATPNPSLATSRPMRAVSLADFGEPVPKRWLILGILGLLVVAIAGIAVAILSRNSNQGTVATVDAGAALAPSDAAAARRPAPQSAPSHVEAAHSAAPTKPPPPPPDGVDDEDARYQSLIELLKHGKDCEERRKAIAPLVELGDPRAVDELKRARHAYYKEYVVITKDANECLTKDADAAAKAIAGS